MDAYYSIDCEMFDILNINIIYYYIILLLYYTIIYYIILYYIILYYIIFYYIIYSVLRITMRKVKKKNGYWISTASIHPQKICCWSLVWSRFLARRTAGQGQLRSHLVDSRSPTISEIVRLYRIYVYLNLSIHQSISIYLSIHLSIW